MKNLLILLVLSIEFTAVSAVQAAVIVTAIEEGGNVVFATDGGTLDLTELTFVSSTTCGGGFLNAYQEIWAVGPYGGCDIYNGISDPGPFGTGEPLMGFLADADSDSGDYLAVQTQHPSSPVSAHLRVPEGFVSGSNISASSSTFLGESFSSLQLIPGTYLYTWPGDSLTFEIVPIPAAVWLFGSALGLLGWMRRGRS